MTIQVESVAFHHNGVAGNCFYLIAFTEGTAKRVAIVFGERGQIAILDPADHAHTLPASPYEPALRAAIEEYELRSDLSTW